MRPRPRAALIALALAVALVDGLPLPPAGRARAVSPALASVVAGLASAQGVLCAPFRPLFDTLLVTERWVLFAGASRERFRLEIAARGAPDSKWQLLYRADDPRHRALADVIEYRRVRGAFNPRTQEPPAGYDAFASFIAGRIFRERPDLCEVRVRMEQIRIRDDGAGYARRGRFVHERTRRRSDVLP
jgi:hypothetical protein